jgi:hypothetical protein
MSVVALWRSFHETLYDRVYLVADSKYSSLAGSNVSPLTPHGQKVFQIRMRARFAPSMGDSRLLFSSDLGLAFVGNVILGQMITGLAGTVLSNLYGFTGAKPPSVEFVALRIALLLKRILSVSAYKGHDRVVDAVLVGNCLEKKSAQAWRIWSDRDGQTYILPFVLTPINASELSAVHFLGDRSAEMSKRLQDRMEADRETSPEKIPLDVMAEVIAEGAFPTIGGEPHGGVLTRHGFNYRSFGRFVKETKSHIFTQPSFLGLLLGDELREFGETKFIPHDFEVRAWQD